MKKVLQWIGIAISTVGLGMLFVYGIPFLLAMLLLAGLESEHAAMDDHAEAALRETGLTAYTEYATWHDLTIDGVITAFELPKYDNHVDNTNIWAGVMAHAATADGWQTEPVSPAEYAAILTSTCPKAAFLLPVDVTFDAHYQQADALAFFDQESGLLVYLRTDRQPHADSIRADKLTIPHNGYVYETETHGGLLGDGTTYQALIVPEEKRTAFEATLSAQADWHNTTISYGDYLVMHDRRFSEVPPLYPAEGTDFEWWSYVDTYARQYPDKEERAGSNDYFPAAMQEIGARWSMNWLVALYDADTGLFIYYEYDS